MGPLITKPIATGGIKRCCLEELETYEGTEVEGTVIRCVDCNNPLIVKGDKWRWDWVVAPEDKYQPKPPKPEKPEKP